MDFDICFLDRKGQLACLMSASFDNFPHAARYARNLLTIGSGGGFFSAEIHAPHQPRDLPLVLGHAAVP